MQLNRLEIKGFKSFGDKVTINFNEGVTAIVGPNGCGKSNVVDAIRWVLGEQSTRMLRSEKMENIIFNGTKSRKPSQLAEVSLTFDNTKNVLPTEFAQVTITRKLYRSGESEYRLNDVTCRLKDITDLFLDTGVGADTYSIIELKMIDEIIANKEGSRRALFEEASGISKYKLRKKQTFQKLKDTEADLSRVGDLLFEIEKNLKTLENQAKKAERYYKIREQYKINSLVLASFKIASFRESLQNLEWQESLQAQEKNILNDKLEKFEADLKKLKEEALTKEKNLSTQQKAANEFTSKIRAYESEKKIKNEQLKYLQEKEKRVSGDLDKDTNQLNHVNYNLKRLQEEQFAEKENLSTLQSALFDKKEELEELKIQLQASKASMESLIKQSQDIQNQLHAAEKELAVLTIQKDALAQEITRNTNDAASREAELNEFSKAIDILKEKLEVKNSAFEKLSRHNDEVLNKISEAEAHIVGQKETLSKDSRKLDSKQNEYNLIKSLVDNLEGFPESIRFLKKNTGWAKQAPLFSDVLFCREEFRIAIENYLDPVMNHYVVETQAEAIQAIRLLSDSAKGRASFFILEAFDLIDIPEHQIISSSNYIPALSIIVVDAKYSRLCNHLLNNVYLSVNVDEEELGNSLPNSPLIILSSSGKFSKNRLSMAGGSVGLFEGKRIGRAKNLENLAKEIRAAENTISSLKTSIDQDSQQLSGFRSSLKKQEIDSLRQELSRLNNELITLNTRQEQYTAFLQNSRNRKQDIELKIRSVEEDILKIEPKLTSLRSLKGEYLVRLQEKQQSHFELSEVLNEKSATFNQENIRYHQQQNKLSGIEKDLEYRSSQQRALITKIDLGNAELRKTHAEINDVNQHVDHSDEDLIGMYAQKDEFEQGVRDAEQQYYQEKGLINESENEILEIRKRKEQSDFIVNELKDKKTALRLELNALKERLAVEFSVDINELIDEEPEDNQPEEDEQSLREKTSRLKQQLDDFGAINSMAMEAYKEMSDRYTFIQSQKEDLLTAKASLMETIKEIDETAKEKFMSAFLNVREDFILVFRSLFNEEDSCDLILSDPECPLESDIDIIARPKGKRPLSINQLSGGEKTLTATALLFSLYLLKPAPFCIFDEVDAPLDDTNIDKFNNIIRKFSDRSQFIIVSHNKRTIASTDIIYGVTMVEQGISRVVAVDLREVA